MYCKFNLSLGIVTSYFLKLQYYGMDFIEICVIVRFLPSQFPIRNLVYVWISHHPDLTPLTCSKCVFCSINSHRYKMLCGDRTTTPRTTTLGTTTLGTTTLGTTTPGTITPWKSYPGGNNPPGQLWVYPRGQLSL